MSFAGSVQSRTIFNSLVRDPLGLMGLALVSIFVLMAVFAPWLSPHDPLKIDVAHKFAGPSLDHPAGTDQLGRDLLSRIIYGARTALGISLLSTGIAGLLGILLGLMAGYGPRW